MISCVLLSAGFSQRFGSPKALARLSQKTLIEDLQDVLVASRVNEIIVVLGDHSEEIKPYLLNHKKIKSVYNNDYKSGQTSSFKKGLTAVTKQCKGVMLLPIDFPLITTKTIDQLIEIFLKKEPLILIPTYQSRKGHPPIFHSLLKEDLLKLDDQTGLNAFQQQYREEIQLCPVHDQGILQTFNTKEEFNRIKANSQNNQP